MRIFTTNKEFKNVQYIIGKMFYYEKQESHFNNII